MMRFGVLGTVAVDCGGELDSVRWPMPRSVLAALLLNANHVVPAGRLVDVLWGDDPPARAVASLQNHVMRLRTLLARTATGRIKTVAPGYLIEVADGDLDLDEFMVQSRRGREALAAGKWETAVRVLTRALALWRGDPLADVTSELLLQQEAPRLAQLRLEALEARIDAGLHLGRCEEAIVELGALTVAYPLREQLHARLMLAYYHASRQAEALDTYRRLRKILANELGIEPGPELQHLHQQILAGEAGPAIATQRPAIATQRPDLSRPAQLPPDLADFTGRDAEVMALTELAGSAGQRPGVIPLCVVTGPGGVGKSSLAVRVAHEVRDRFPDGQLYARLGGASASPADRQELLGRFLRELGADPARIPAGEPERAAQFRSTLAGRRVLILLDDTRDSGQILPLLPGTAGCAVIVTSRNPLADLAGALRLPLAALPSGQALEFLSKIIGSDRVECEAQAAADVARLCAGLPLALRIAGSRLAARPHWRIQDLASRLAGAGARLDQLSVGDLSVRASLAVSYTNLRADQDGGLTPARAFRLLGLWQGPDISTPAAAALFGTDVPTAEDALEALLDGFLVQAADSAGRYLLHELPGAYAAERAREEESPAEMDAALGRLLAWYLHSTIAADQAMVPGGRPVPLGQPPDGVQPCQLPSPSQAVHWLKAELPNLHAAVRVAAAREDHQTAWKLAAALCTYHLRQGRWADWIDTEIRGLASARASGDCFGEAWLLNGMAVAHWLAGEGPSASQAQAV